jgi:hypothetical protein
MISWIFISKITAIFLIALKALNTLATAIFQNKITQEASICVNPLRIMSLSFKPAT